MITPLFCWIIVPSTARQQYTTPFKLTSSPQSITSMGISWNGSPQLSMRPSAPPAQFSSRSMRPNFSKAAVAAASTCP